MTNYYDKFKIITNNVSRDLFPLSELSAKEITAYSLEYISGEESNSLRLFRYKGWVYDSYEFTTTRNLPSDNPILKGGWEGIYNDSYFSGIVIKYPLHGDNTIIVGSFYC